jgi:hypothetical protein
MPRYLELAPTDPAGLREEPDLPVPLPYNLTPRDILRTVEDVHGILHEVNSLLHGRGFERLEELLDSAGFSGFVSRTIVDRLARLSRTLVMNRQHNGFPDLLPRGVYPGDAIQHGTRGGLEVKASRYEASWQSHGPRGGWFLVTQFEIDQDLRKAVHDREPTRVRAAMIAELTRGDWSWQPAREGRIRSGTASMRQSGLAKLRRGAVWVDHEYEPRHQQLLGQASLGVFGADADDRVLAAVTRLAREVRAADVSADLSPEVGVPAGQLEGRVTTALRRLARDGKLERVRPGIYVAPEPLIEPA